MASSFVLDRRVPGYAWHRPASTILLPMPLECRRRLLANLVIVYLFLLLMAGNGLTSVQLQGEFYLKDFRFDWQVLDNYEWL
jgi:hypothetical protein